MKRPAFQFYPADWRKDAALQSCSVAAQGLWINLMCIAHECEPYGHLTVNGRPMVSAQLARLVGLPERDCDKLLTELLNAGVASRTEEGVTFSRRMVRDENLRNVRAEAGRLGGNPALLGNKVNQKPTPSSSSSTSSSKKEKAPAAPIVGLEAIPQDLLDEWKGVRAAKRAGKITPTVVKALEREAAKAGISIEAAVRKCVERGWVGFEADWLKDAKQKAADVARMTVPGPAPSNFLADQAAHIAAVRAEREAKLARKAQAA